MEALFRAAQATLRRMNIAIWIWGILVSIGAGASIATLGCVYHMHKQLHQMHETDRR